MSDKAFIAGVPVAVDPLEIERELAALWKPASEQEGGEGAVVRACLANLVVFVPAAAERDRAVEALREVFRDHPNRTILLLVDEGKRPGAAAGDARGGSRLEASISTLCSFIDLRSAPVCCEQITLRAAPGESDLFAGAVAPLLVPDIPVVLWWLGECEGPLLGELGPLADRVVVDSRRAAAGRPALADIERLLRDGTAREVADLAWRDLERWRLAVADLHDDPAARALIREVRAVEVDVAAEAGATPPPLCEGALLAGWIASRLGWELEESRRDGAAALGRFRAASGAEVDVRVGPPPDPSPGPPPAGCVRGDPVALRLRAAGNASWVSIEVAGGRPGEAVIDFCTDVSCRLPRVIPFRRRSESELLGSVLDRRPHAAVFAAALRPAARMLGAAS